MAEFPSWLKNNQEKNTVKKSVSPPSWLTGSNNTTTTNTNQNNISWGQNLLGAVDAGAARYNSGIAGVLDATKLSYLPGVNQFNEWQKKAADESITKYSEAPKTKAQQIVGDILSSGVQVAADIPLMLASAPVKGAQLAATKLPAVANAVKQFVSKPVNIERTAVYFGNDYLEAKKEGASELQAVTRAIVSAIPTAIIEGAGGLDTIAKKVVTKQASSGGKAIFRDILKSALEEGMEEVAQYPLGAASKAVYRDNVPLYSTTEEAVINPKEMAYSGALGAVAGGVFGGGISAANTAMSNKPKINNQVSDVKPPPEVVEKAAQPTKLTPQQNSQVDTGGETKIRKFAQSVMNSDIVQDKEINIALNNDLLAGVNSYTVLPNKKVVEQAKKTLENIPAAVGMWDAVVNGNTTPSAYDVALGEQLLTEAAAMKDVKAVQKLVSELALVGTRSGQAVQAFSLLKKLTPEGKLYYIQKFVDNTNGRLAESKEYKGKYAAIKIDEKLQQELLNANTIAEMEAAEGKIIESVARQIPSTTAEKINAYRYLSMLGNPKTHLRNIIGNSLMVLNRKIKNTVGSGLEAIFVEDGGERTKAILPSSKLILFAENDYKNIQRQITSGQKYGFEENISNKKQVFKAGWLNKLKDFNMNKLEQEDAFFLKWAYSDSLAGYMKANKLTPETITDSQLNRARQYSIEEARKATFRDASKLASLLNKIEKSGTVGRLAVGGVIPFKKTPANILKRGVEYSPVGLMDALSRKLFQFSKGDISANEFVDRLSSGLTGTGIAILGLYLAKWGIVSVAGDDKDRVNYYEQMQGKQPYSITIGDKSYTIDWAAPSALPLFIGAEYFNQKSRDSDTSGFNRLLEAITKITDPLLEMTMLQGVESTFSSFNQDAPLGSLGNIGKEVVKNYAGQFVPTIFGQAARTIDDTRRTTYAPKDSPVTKDIETFGRKMANKIPGASLKSEPYVDMWGREERDTNTLSRAAENFLSPSYWQSPKVTEVDKEINRLYKQMGEVNIIPKSPDRYVEVDGKRYDLTAKEYTEYQKDVGQTAYNILNKGIKDSTYKDMPDAEKVNIFEKAYEYSRAIAKDEYLEKQGVNYELESWIETTQKVKSLGVSEGDWLLTYYEITNAKGKKDKNGKTISGSVKQAKWDIVNKMALSGQQKQRIWEILGYK